MRTNDVSRTQMQMSQEDRRGQPDGVDVVDTVIGGKELWRDLIDTPKRSWCDNERLDWRPINFLFGEECDGNFHDYKRVFRGGNV